MTGSRMTSSSQSHHPLILPASAAFTTIGARLAHVSNERGSSLKRSIFTDNIGILTLTLLLLITSYLFTSFAAYSQRMRLNSNLIDTDLVFHGIATAGGVQHREDRRLSSERRRLHEAVMEPSRLGGNAAGIISAESPIRIVILTTWRAGSTFLGQILSSHPAAFYQHEPLFGYLPLNARSTRGGRQRGIQAVKNLLNCQYDFLPNAYFEEKRLNSERELHKNDRLRTVCESDGISSLDPTRQATESRAVRHLPGLPSCFSADFLGRLCSLYPVRVLKEVRLAVASARGLLLDDRANDGIKVVFLVRDPRGIMESRRHVPWCKGVPGVDADVESSDRPNRTSGGVTGIDLSSVSRPSCSTAKYLCAEMLEDYHDAKDLAKLHPGKFHVLRYEDLATDPQRLVPDLFTFIGTPMAKETVDYLKVHTSTRATSRTNMTIEELSDGWANMIRDSKTNPFKWTKLLSPTAIKNVEKRCLKVMKLFGYKPVGGLLAHAEEQTNTGLQPNDVFDPDYRFATA